MSILNTSPSNNRFFDAEIAEALGDINAAVTDIPQKSL